MSKPNPLKRKGPKITLPLSAFTPPNSGTKDSFPDASTLHPTTVVDANVVVSDSRTLEQWKKEASQSIHLANKLDTAVVSAPAIDAVQIASLIPSDVQVLSLSLPFSLEESTPDIPSLPVPIHLSTTYIGTSDTSIKSLRWALQQGRPVEVDPGFPLSEASFEQFEDLIAKATDGLRNIPPIVISNTLPPPEHKDVALVKLMTDPAYRRYQSQIAALSFIPSLVVKYAPPATMPESTYGDAEAEAEWERRIKAYLGTAIEAFGYERIMFASSSSDKAPTTHVAQWYGLARECFIEFAVDQACVDAVFGGNAMRVYGSNTGRR
ncbi:hypothetical protein FISHEDRAFT_32201 [Fistulina hepatica ATCC 64428]|uniref:Amidohydrolase-related domain-containing protein n=1 Tax=Fistulina hepatica ATCC 64428 TaxID=1128425 RepID=A0A0D7ARI7_9AGAR|nr:hypothetical protein FISHEDRAFT_32201 [Fistulina hepatica ATCC 64428]